MIMLLTTLQRFHTAAKFADERWHLTGAKCKTRVGGCTGLCVPAFDHVQATHVLRIATLGERQGVADHRWVATQDVGLDRDDDFRFFKIQRLLGGFAQHLGRRRSPCVAANPVVTCNCCGRQTLF